MNAVLREPEAQPDALVTRYAKPEELEVIAAFQPALQEAETRVKQVEQVIRETRAQIDAKERTQWKGHLRSAAVALGEVAPAMDSGPTLRELQDQSSGLQLRAREAEDVVATIKGRQRRARIDLIATCAERCMNDYALFTDEQAWCHQQIAAAQQVVGTAHKLIDELVWNRYSVPGSPYILANKNREEWGVPLLMSADRLSLTNTDAAKGLGFN